MYLLLDTSTSICKISMVDGDWRKDFEWEASRELAKHLLKYIQEKLSDNGKDWTDISGLGVFEGPGSFTGLRIGLTVMNTLADSLNIPIISGRGDNWQRDVLSDLADGKNQKIVLPFYGGEANITNPKK